MLSVSEDGLGAKELRGNKWGKTWGVPCRKAQFALVWAQSRDQPWCMEGDGERKTLFSKRLLSSLWFDEKVDKNWKGHTLKELHG